MVVSFCGQRFCSAFTRTACRAKNRRNTSPKMNSSTRSAMANEKTIPATIAIAVIASCMTCLLWIPVNLELLSGPNSAGGLSARHRYRRTDLATEELSGLLIAFPADFDRIADTHHRE